MSEPLDILTYQPIREWTGDIIDFGMPTHDGNVRLTEIVTSSQGALEATMRAIDVSEMEDLLAPAREPDKLKIIRMFFGDQEEVDILPAIEAAEAFITNYLDIHMNLTGKTYEISFGGYHKIGLSGAHTEAVEKEVEPPRILNISTGFISHPADWNLDGMPYISFSWDDVDTPRCSNSNYTTQGNCEASIITPDFCRDVNLNEIMVHRMSDPDTWIPFASSSGVCLNLNVGCYYSSNGTSWSWSNANTGEDPEASCATYASENSTYYYHWYADNYTWGGAVYNSWWPTTETTSAHIHYNLMEQINHHFYPETWSMPIVPEETIHYNEISDSGIMTPGRSTRAWFVTNTFEFENGVIDESPIDPDIYLIAGMPAHNFVDTNNSRPLSVYGYTNYYDRARIRFKSPQQNTAVGNRAFSPPDRFRIYRSRYWHYGSNYSGSDYQYGIKTLAGEVERIDDSFHYFDDWEQDLRALGLESYQGSYYYVTAVWDDWNWHRGLSVTKYDNYSNGDFDSDFSWFDTATVLDSWEDWYIDEYHNSSSWRYIAHQYRGFFRASVTGTYTFYLNSDDSGWLWLGNSGETVNSLESRRSDTNELIDNSGDHPAVEVSATINLVEGNIYPILMYHGQGWGGMTFDLSFTPPGGTRTYDGSNFYYPDEAIIEGQEVEGRFSSMIYSYFR